MENAAAWLVDLLIIALYFFVNQQVWTQKCTVQKASVNVNISYY